MRSKPFTLPFILPIGCFATAIGLGAFVLSLSVCAVSEPVSFIDALFISTSSVCVTGLASVDPSLVFNRFGHSVMLALIQLGGLGITTYSTLIFYLWSRRVSLADRLAVGEVLLNDSSFHLGSFLQRVIIVIAGLELLGAIGLYVLEPERIGVFNSVFLAVSAFCNAGFALWPDNLAQWRSHWGVNLIIMTLIICGGLGFAVLDECLRLLRKRCAAFFSGFSHRHEAIRAPGQKKFYALSYHSRIVLSTTLFLVIFGAVLLMIPEYFANDDELSTLPDLILPSLFQSVTARTAGFATVDISRMTDASLLTLIMLMVIGGSPGSCAGGLKTTSVRVLLGFIAAQLKGRAQVVVANRAIDSSTMNKVFVLLTFTSLAIALATIALTYSEGGANPHGKTPFQSLDLFFEAVSAFATVGLSTNLSPMLSPTGKIIDCILMFIGRLGPIWIISTIQQFQTEPRYRLPNKELPIG